MSFWAAISYKGLTDIFGMEGGINELYYTQILEAGLLQGDEEAFDEAWTVQHENAPSHIAHQTKQWLDTENVEFLQCPAMFPGINIIENVRGVFFRVYKTGKIYENVQELADASFEAWNLSS